METVVGLAVLVATVAVGIVASVRLDPLTETPTLAAKDPVRSSEKDDPFIVSTVMTSFEALNVAYSMPLAPRPPSSIAPTPTFMPAMFPAKLPSCELATLVAVRSSVPLLARLTVSVLATDPLSASVEPLAMLRVSPPLTLPRRFSVPPFAVTAPVPLTFAETVPKPVRLAPEPIVKPEASVSEPFCRLITPFVMLSAALSVSVLPALTSSV